MEIEDIPRFSWRGMHLDVCRHFMPKEFVKKYLDLLARYKMNVFHWHLTDDRGWRIEIEGYPELTEITAWRSDNGSVTEDFVYFRHRESDHLQERFITIIPEIEMPGRTVRLWRLIETFLYRRPFLSGNSMGIFDDVFCAGNDQTF